MAPKVLMVAEKPSIALSIASALSGGRMSTRKGSTDVHEFDGTFQGSYANFKVTSVIGHVLSVDFPPAYQNWEATDPVDLFEAPVLRSECNPKVESESTSVLVIVSSNLWEALSYTCRACKITES